ncbi:MAG: T9SS type A sorting domain-containing protein [Bacteroidetes bacterium]|nr:MAG: T9SS type A sorting domain-containing protein [Bacteroidota bacterium]
MKKLLSIVLLLMAASVARSQYAPRAGQPGSTAIAQDSSAILSWGISCQVNRGLLDVTQPDSGFASIGEASFAVGKADAYIVSLGDGGSATLTFDPPIVDGPGYDFAVFENGFNINGDSDFLELAFVEVSSNGVDFFRFPAYCALDSSRQQKTYDGAKAEYYHNLAGKYTARYGTPFDLKELDSIAVLDLMSITHVRIVDVIGTVIDSLASRGADGQIINDPWPTLFPQGGFDLDAVGVIHNQHAPNGVSDLTRPTAIYPNPVKKGQSLNWNREAEWFLYSLDGKLMDTGYGTKLETQHMSTGIYLLRLNNSFQKVEIR